MSAKKLLVSEPFRLGGRREWRVALYAPTARYKQFRIAYKRPVDADVVEGPWDWRAYAADTEAEARSLFTEVVAAVESLRAAPPTRRERRRTTVAELAAAYLEHSRQTVEERTAEGRECVVRVHIIPVLGTPRSSSGRPTGAMRSSIERRPFVASGT